MSKENRVSAEDRLRLHVTDPETFQFSFEDADALVEEIDALRSKPVAGAEVKPLEWSKLYTDGNGYSATDARCVVGLYSAFQLSGDTAWILEFGNGRLGDFDSLDQAKAAAEADYRQRILSALIPKATAPVVSEPVGYISEKGLAYLRSGEVNGAASIEPVSMRAANIPLYASPQPEAVITAPHRHKKRGTEYVLIGIGKMQAEHWWTRDVDHHGRASQAPVDMREVAIYRSATDPTEIWVRPREEFEDGRFEAITAALKDGN